jgi:transcriptional regulator with XRE-family HTH domain
MKSQKELKSTLKLLGQRIYHVRIVKDITTKEIAPMLSLSPEAYRNIEKGDCDVSFTTLLLITKILEIDFSELIKTLGEITYITHL